MNARNKALLVFLLLAFNAHAGEPHKITLEELRQLPDGAREAAFSQQDETAKVELFFQANRRHPPYTGLDDAIEKEGKGFLALLRNELDARGGVPEVLSFMGIVFDMKKHRLLSSSDIQALRINGICHLAKLSKYCPELEAKLLAP